MSGPNDCTVALITTLAEQGFLGVLTFKFQRGRVVHITKEESIQPNQQEPSYRGKNDEHDRAN